MIRTFEIEPIASGWKLKMYEDGEEVGGGGGGPDDYDFLVETGMDFVGPPLPETE